MFDSPVAGAYCNKSVSVVQKEGQLPGLTPAPKGPALLCELPSGNGLSAFTSSLSGSCEFSFWGCQTKARLRTVHRRSLGTPDATSWQVAPSPRAGVIRDCARLRLSALRFWKGSSPSTGEEPFRHLYAWRGAVSVPRLTYFNVSLHRSHARGAVAPMKSSVLRARLLLAKGAYRRAALCAHLPFGGQHESITSKA